MKKDDLVSSFGSLVFFVLGVLLLATIPGWINADALYATLLPVMLMTVGVLLYSQHKDKQKQRMVGGGVVVIGFLTLLVRFDAIKGDTVHFVLGIALLLVGVVPLARKYGVPKPTAKPVEKID